jgi:RNA polymerase sigma factor (sigma-70 family)
MSSEYDNAHRCMLTASVRHERPTPITHHSEGARELVRRCLEGDDAAWERFAHRYWPFCHRVARSVLGRRHASYAPDVTQEVFVVLPVKLRTLQRCSDHSLAAWLATFTRRRALNLLRTLRRWCREHSAQMPQMACSRDPPNRSSDLATVVASTRRRLTERQDRVLDALLDDCSHREAALRVGASIRSVRRDAAAIRMVFQEILEKMQIVGR